MHPLYMVKETFQYLQRTKGLGVVPRGSDRHGNESIGQRQELDIMMLISLEISLCEG